MDHAAHHGAAAQQSFDDWHAAGGSDAPLHVVGLLSIAQVDAMRAEHAAAGLELDLDVVPAGGVNAGKFYVSGSLAPEMYAAMRAAHAEGDLALNIRSGPPGMVMGYRDDDDDDMDDEDEYEDMDEPGDIDRYDDDDDDHWHGHMLRPHAAAGVHAGKFHRRGWRGKHGWRGAWRGLNYDVAWGCSHWERDWHQDGCGKVHVHNLADWAPNHHGWGYGFPYGGWDEDFWPHVRGDGGHVWYTGEFWRNANIVHDVPVWFDAHWAANGDAYPDRFWLSAWSGHHWRGLGCGCGGCKAINRCNRCAKWRCGCDHHRCGCR